MTTTPYPRAYPFLYAAIRAVMRLLFRLLTRVRVAFEDSLPLRGPAIVVVNHVSYFDGPFVFSMMPMRVRPLVAERFQRHIFKPILTVTGAIFVHRGLPDRAALRAITAILEDGGVLAVAIEGYLSPDGRMQMGKNGVAYLAAKTGAPVIPAALWGTESIVRSWKRLRRAEIHLRVGRPLELEERDVSRLDASTAQITRSIAAMLPERYRPQEPH